MLIIPVRQLSKGKRNPYHLLIQFTGKTAQGTKEDQNKAILAYLDGNQLLYNNMSNDFKKSIATAREWSGLTREKIAEYAEIEVRHLDRVLKGEVQKTETVIRVLLAMRLPPMVTIHLLQVAPCPWSLSAKKHAVYNWAIYSMDGCDVKEIMERLEELGYPL